MLNIQCCGFSQGEKKALKAKIDKALQKLDLGDEAITDFFYDNPESCDGKCKPMPYIRVCSTGGMDEIMIIVKALQAANIGVDCETLVLNRFIPAEQMRK